MLIQESGNNIFVTIEPSDWKTKGKYILELIKSIPGRQYYPADKSWKISKQYKNYLAEFLSPFTLEEELEGQKALEDLFDLLDGISYSL